MAEFLGTGAFVFLISAAVVSDFLFGNIGTVGIGLVAGFALAAVMMATVRISGANLNPVVTLAMWLTGKIPGANAFFYIVCQVLASLAAAGLVFLIFGQNAVDVLLGAPVLGGGILPTNALIMEAVGSALLVFVYMMTFGDKRTAGLGPLAVGLAFVALTVVAYPFSGAAFNPARAVGPYLISGNVQQALVWIIGPLVGSLLGLVYDWVFLKKGRKG